MVPITHTLMITLMNQHPKPPTPPPTTRATKEAERKVKANRKAKVEIAKTKATITVKAGVVLVDQVMMTMIV